MIITEFLLKITKVFGMFSRGIRMLKLVRLVLILLLVFSTVLSTSGCAPGPVERPGDLREQSMDWPSPRHMGQVPEPRPPEEQR